VKTLGKLVIFFSLSFAANLLFAQGGLDRTHPRVAELQDKMTGYARDYLKTRLPDSPFLVNVRIEPLRRDLKGSGVSTNERLPYFDVDDEEVVDEWDDPKASIYDLQARIQKATVVVALPKSIKDTEADEIKDSLTALLRLVPGRDEVRIERRSWSMGPTFWYYVGLSFATALFVLFGLLFVSRTWARKLANAIHDIKPKENDNSEAASAMNVSGMGVDPGRVNQAGAGDLKFRDPLRTREFVNARVQELMRAQHFPNLQAMIEMDKLSQRSPRDLGALLMEFPKTKQEEIFGLTYHSSWLDAFSNPGELSGQTLEVLDRISRIHGDQYDKEWDRLLIQVWRFGEDRVRFLKTINKDEAFCILRAMPTSISVPAARLAFPGNWAVLLDPSYEPKPLPEGRRKEIMWYLLEGKPLLDFKALEKYRQEKDLLEYLQMAGVNEERDIYEALPADSILWQVRPPFYKAVSAEQQVLATVFERVTLADWALALFNVPRDLRQPIEAMFNSKQKFLFMNKMKSIDADQVDRLVLGLAREKIGRIHAEVVKSAKVAQQMVDSVLEDVNDTAEKNDSDAA